MDLPGYTTRNDKHRSMLYRKNQPLIYLSYSFYHPLVLSWLNECSHPNHDRTSSQKISKKRKENYALINDPFLIKTLIVEYKTLPLDDLTSLYNTRHFSLVHLSVE